MNNVLKCIDCRELFPVKESEMLNGKEDIKYRCYDCAMLCVLDFMLKDNAQGKLNLLEHK